MCNESKMNLIYFKTGVTCPKTKYHKSTDTLRIPQVDHNYRYPKISQIFKPVYFCRYVGEIKGFKPNPITTISCITIQNRKA
jgi:hypothetical protein